MSPDAPADRGPGDDDDDDNDDDDDDDGDALSRSGQHDSLC